MYAEDWSEESTGRPLSAEQALAMRVLEIAAADFLCQPDRGALGSPRYVHRLTDEELTRAIEAGEFLLERDDRVTRVWFTLAGLRLESRECFRPEWRRRLAQLRFMRREREKRPAPADVRRALDHRGCGHARQQWRGEVAHAS